MLLNFYVKNELYLHCRVCNSAFFFNIDHLVSPTSSAGRSGYFSKWRVPPRRPRGRGCSFPLLPRAETCFSWTPSTFCSAGYGYRPRYNAENDQRKRINSKTLWNDLKTVLFENAVFLVSLCERRKRCYLKTMTSPQQHPPPGLQTTQP